MGSLKGLSPLDMFGLFEDGVGLVRGFTDGEVGYAQQRENEKFALEQLQQRQALQERQAIENANQTRSEIAEAAKIDAEKRRSALKRAVARQRASFGGSGISSSGGSSEAVLLGFFDETQDELDQRQRLDSLRSNALDLGVAQQQSLNLLQREQLRQSQKMNDLASRYGRINNVLDFGMGAAKYGTKLYQISKQGV